MDYKEMYEQKAKEANKYRDLLRECESGNKLLMKCISRNGLEIAELKEKVEKALSTRH